jgi:ligand-binding sensor protein
MSSNDIQLTDLINLEEWQKIQDSFSEVTSVTLRTFSPDGNLLSVTSRPNRLCDELLTKASRNLLCTKCLSEAKVEAIRNVKGDLNLKCPFDFNLFVIPIKAVGENIIAYLVLGPVLLEAKKNISVYSKEAEKSGIAMNILADAIAATKITSLAKIDALVKLIEKVFSYIAQTGYHKKRLGEIVPEVVELDPSFSFYYEKKLLRALLNACISALDADSGSVMIVDKETNTLHIKVASQLDQNVINNTEIEMGEGIAGMAAATCESILLPNDEGKNHLSEKMKRRYINSSLIVPFNRENTRNVYGVINLNITRKDIQFSDRDIQLVKSLVNMISVALIPVRQNNGSSGEPRSHSNN